MFRRKSCGSAVVNFESSSSHLDMLIFSQEKVGRTLLLLQHSQRTTALLEVFKIQAGARLCVSALTSRKTQRTRMASAIRVLNLVAAAGSRSWSVATGTMPPRGSDLPAFTACRLQPAGCHLSQSAVYPPPVRCRSCAAPPQNLPRGRPWHAARGSRPSRA